MMAHTQTRWVRGEKRSIVAQAFDGSFKNIVDRVRGSSPAEAEANTEVIRAAAEMYQALRRIVEAARSVDHSTQARESGSDRCPSYLLGKVEAIADGALWWEAALRTNAAVEKVG